MNKRNSFIVITEHIMQFKNHQNQCRSRLGTKLILFLPMQRNLYGLDLGNEVPELPKFVQHEMEIRKPQF